MIQNNQIFHQTWFEKQSILGHDSGSMHYSATSQSRSNINIRRIYDGFEYAVQPDGSSLAENIWRQNNNGTTISLHSLFANSNLSTGNQTAGNGMRRDQRVPFLSLSSIDCALMDATMHFTNCQSLPPPQQPSTSVQPNENKQYDMIMATTVNSNHVIHNNEIIKEDDDILGVLSPRLKVRNRHNAIYGQHLPNALNSPGCSMKVFGGKGLLQEQTDACKSLFRGQLPLNQESDSRHTRNLHSTSHIKSTPNPYENNEILELRRNETSLNQVYSIDDNDEQVHSSDFDYFSASNAVVSSVCAPFTPAVQNNSDFGASFSGNTSNSIGGVRGVDTVHDDFDISNFDLDVIDQAVAQRSGNGSSNDAKFDLEYSKHYKYTSTGPCNIGSSETNYNLHENDASISGMFGNESLFSVGGVPLCSGHNEPCKVLTSKSSANPGRQFYKCAKQESECCNFFEWVDGISSSINQSNSDVGYHYDANVSRAPTGDTKNIFEENRRKFGHNSFRKGQKDVIQSAVDGRDVFVLMPTGGGKSLCYQLPAWCCPGLSVIVSPLLSLIEDQLQSMTKLGIDTVTLSSNKDFDGEGKNIMHRLRHLTPHGGIKMLYITPEKLARSSVVKSILRDLTNKGLISRFVIDEAHCLR